LSRTDPFTSGSTPVYFSLFGMKRISVLISNDSVVRIFAISSVRFRFDRNSRVSRATISKTLSFAPSAAFAAYPTTSGKLSRAMRRMPSSVENTAPMPA
jgi:hypothetical protein